MVQGFFGLAVRGLLSTMKRFLCGLAALGPLGLLPSCAAVAQADFTIMPLGDSITYGVGEYPQNVLGGYRTRLYSDLHDAGYSFSFVGTSTENPSSLISQVGQTHHEGHPGYRIDQITNNLDGDGGSGNFSNNNGGFWFHKPAPPDVILLHIGTNDIIQNFHTSTMAQRLDQLIGQIVADSPTSRIFVSSIIPIPFVGASSNQLVQDYNTQIRDVIVPKYESLGDNVFFVDQYPNFVDAKGNAVHLGPGGIHPDQVGYDLMGDTWAAAIQQAAPVPEPSTLLLLGRVDRMGGAGIKAGHGMCGGPGKGYLEPARRVRVNRSLQPRRAIARLRHGRCDDEGRLRSESLGCKNRSTGLRPTR